MRIRTDSGPRTAIFSTHESVARLIADELNFEAIVILPDDGLNSTVGQLVAQRGKTLDREISRRRKRKPVLVQPKPLQITNKSR